jgi:3-hydroxyacyl-CoA dehydrogenase
MVGLDVAIAIGERIGVPAPAPVYELVAAGKLGRKTGEGFHVY